MLIIFILNGCGSNDTNNPLPYEMTEQKDGFWSIQRENNNTLYGFFYIEKNLFFNKDTNTSYIGLSSNYSNNKTTKLRIDLDRRNSNQVKIDTGLITAITNNKIISNAFLETANIIKEAITFKYIDSEIITNLNNFDGLYKDGNSSLNITNGIINIVDSQDCNSTSLHNIENNYIVDFSQQNCTFSDNGKFLVKIMDDNRTIYIGKIFYYPSFGTEKIFRFIKQ